MYDLVIRNARVVDGSGGPAFFGDVAVEGGLICEVARRESGEKVSGYFKREIQANGALLTPGFIDAHTHYDGQVRWDRYLTPSCWHGVTTTFFGNCGVGFAPVRPGSEEWLIGLMEGVEDIPGSALSLGMNWNWETFPQYLDVLARDSYVMNIGLHVPHGAVRAYVMNQRSTRNDPATSEEIKQMSAIIREGMKAGAVGVSTSRTINHLSKDGEPVPGTFANEEELFALAEAMGSGVFQVVPRGAGGEDPGAPLREMGWMEKLSHRYPSCSVAFTLFQYDSGPNAWKVWLELTDAAVSRGANLYPLVSGRPFGMLVGLRLANPFSRNSTYVELSNLPFEERLLRMRDPEIKSKILSENPATVSPYAERFPWDLKKIFPLGNPPNYEPREDESVAGLAQKLGRDEKEYLYELLLENNGENLLLRPLFGYSDFNMKPTQHLLEHPRAIVSLGDGGAHCGLICDASLTTSMLTHWSRDRNRGPKLPLERVVQMLTADQARVWKLPKKGLIQKGYDADLNLIDYDRLQLLPPKVEYDLPGGGRRIIQGAKGYLATLVSGVVTLENDQTTGEMPGKLIRGSQFEPQYRES